MKPENKYGVFRIRSKKDYSLWWSNEAGWVDFDSASVFSKEESTKLNLPTNGKWVDCENLSPIAAALNAFRRMYDAMENGADVDEILEDETYWPLELLREAVETEERGIKIVRDSLDEDEKDSVIEIITLIIARDPSHSPCAEWYWPGVLDDWAVRRVVTIDHPAV